MQMWVKLEGLSPTVQHGEEADVRSQMLGVGGNRLESFCRGPEENSIDHFLVLVGQGGDLCRNREHDVIVGAIQQLVLTILDPLRSRQALAFGAMAIPAAVKTIAFVATLVATLEMPSQRRRSTHLDGRHDPPL